MTYQQYWDCDRCGERYPYNIGTPRAGDYHPIERENPDGDPEVEWLCDKCSDPTHNKIGEAP